MDLPSTLCSLPPQVLLVTRHLKEAGSCSDHVPGDQKKFWKTIRAAFSVRLSKALLLCANREKVLLESLLALHRSIQTQTDNVSFRREATKGLGTYLLFHSTVCLYCAAYAIFQVRGRQYCVEFVDSSR